MKFTTLVLALALSVGVYAQKVTLQDLNEIRTKAGMNLLIEGNQVLDLVAREQVQNNIDNDLVELTYYLNNIPLVFEQGNVTEGFAWDCEEGLDLNWKYIKAAAADSDYTQVSVKHSDGNWVLLFLGEK